jgi:O-antigen/teichoic acid export membrane protein
MSYRRTIHILLKKSQRILKTDMAYVGKNGFWITAGQSFSIVSTLLLSVLFANLVPMNEYGIYKYILSLIAIIGIFKLSGMPNAVVQASAKNLDGTFREAIRTSLHWGLIPLAFSVSVAGYYVYNGNLLIGSSIFIATLLNVVTGAYGLYGSYLNGKHDFKRSVLYSVVTQFISTIAVVSTLLVTHNIFLIIVVSFLSTTLLVCFFSHQTRKHIDTSKGVDTEALALGKHMSFMNILGGLAMHLDKVFIFQKLGPIELAVYSFAIAIPEQIKGAYKNILSIAISKYATLSKEHLRISVVKKIQTISVITAVLICVYIFSAPVIFQILFPKYTDSVIYSQLYVFGLIFVPSILLFNTYFQVQRRTAILYKINVIGNISNLMFTFVLIYLFGLWGAIWLSIVSKLTILTLSIFYFWKDRE